MTEKCDEETVLGAVTRKSARLPLPRLAGEGAPAGAGEGVHPSARSAAKQANPRAPATILQKPLDIMHARFNLMRQIQEVSNFLSKSATKMQEKAAGVLDEKRGTHILPDTVISFVERNMRNKCPPPPLTTSPP
jgi:hypothetical protein